ncbi:MAG: isoaspartyl peptidase/L-asparaginase [Bacteroidota bacterium]
MRLFYLFSLLVCLLAACAQSDSSETENTPTMDTTDAPDWALVIHGGAGTILPEHMTDDRAADIRAAMSQAIAAGEEVLSNGGTATDAVEATIHILEDSPHFNAGKGAVFTHDGTNSLDASFMTGHDRQAGAVAGVTNIKNPISLARAVLDHSEHVMLSGQGAEDFALSRGMDTISADWFYTEGRYQSLQRVLEQEAEGHSSTGAILNAPDRKYGTVGCVALDQQGNIAAGTSTGGMTNKRYDRIGDSPVIGAGTFADNASCGVSCTGHGEYFIRWAVAHDVHARMTYGGASLEEAANAVIHEVLPEVGGSGGLIALDQAGNISMPFNTPGMYRGYKRAGEEEYIEFYGE